MNGNPRQRGRALLAIASLLVAVWGAISVSVALSTAPVSEPRRGSTYGFTGATLYNGVPISNDTMAVFNLPGHTLTTTFSLMPEGDYPYDATMNQAGGEVWVVGNIGDAVVVVDAAALTITQRVTGVGDYPVDLIFSKDGGRAFVANRDSEDLAVLDTQSYAVLTSYPITSSLTPTFEPGKMAVNRCTGDLYLVDWYEDYLLRVDPDGGQVLDEIDAGASLWDMVMDPTATTLYVTDRGSDQVHVVDLASFAVVDSIGVGDDPWGIDITPDGRFLFVANEDSHDVSVIDTAAGVVTTTIAISVPWSTDQPDPRDVEISADGLYAYVPSGDVNFATHHDAIIVIDTATLQQVDAIDIDPARNPNVVAVAPQLPSLDPLAGFTSNSPVPLGTPVEFTDTSSNNPTSWSWDFGDGVGNSTLQNPVYNYGNAGAYTVTLTVTNACGGDTFAAPVTVLGDPTPTATATTVPEDEYDLYLPVIVRW